MDFNVMTFNLRINVASDGENAWPNRVEAAAETIRQSGAVMIGTQELSLEMIRDLERKLTEFSWIGQGREGELKGEFSAIFYRKDIFEVMDNGTFWLSETPEVPGSKSWDSDLPRICTWARLRHEKGKEIYFCNTHLDHIGSDARVNGLRVIAEKMFLKEMNNKIPLILTGDFNIEPNSEAIRYLKNVKSQDITLKNAYDEKLSNIDEILGLTFHDFKGGKEGDPIDYIFVSDHIKINSLSINRNKVLGRYPSDHYPVSAILEI